MKKNANILKINRSEDCIRVAYHYKNKLFEDQFSLIILTTPIDKISHLYNKLSSLEDELVKNVRYAPYVSVNCKLSNIMDNCRIVMTDGSKRDFLRLIVNKNGVTTCYISIDIEDFDKKKIYRELTNELKKYNIEIKEILNINMWPNYFPHFNKQKYYSKLNLLQGQNNTYYVGGIGLFEDLENTLQYTKDIVRKL